ncbi:MAG: MerR family transcriptional regulator [Spirochaetes bacterium]|nr:MerR family transcriptional regulator [Spirochaetota bacterium]
MKNKEILNNTDKMYFTIGEVSQIVGVQQHVLRNWEKEIGFLKPVKKTSGHRLYKKKDVQIAMRIKELLYDELYTIPGARKRLWYELKKNRFPSVLALVKRTKKQLADLLDVLKKSD